MQTTIVKEGFIGEWFSPLIENADPTGLDEEDLEQFTNWEASLPEGSLSIQYDDDPSFGIDEVTGQLGLVYPYQIIRFRA